MIAPVPFHCFSITFVYFQLSIKSDSISFQDICAKSVKCYAGHRSSGCNIIIIVHCFGERSSKIGEFINNLYILSIHGDGLFTVRFFKLWLVYHLSFFVLILSSHMLWPCDLQPLVFFL